METLAQEKKRSTREVCAAPVGRWPRLTLAAAADRSNRPREPWLRRTDSKQTLCLQICRTNTTQICRTNTNTKYKYKVKIHKNAFLQLQTPFLKEHGQTNTKVRARLLQIMCIKRNLDRLTDILPLNRGTVLLNEYYFFLSQKSCTPSSIE